MRPSLTLGRLRTAQLANHVQDGPDRSRGTATSVLGRCCSARGFGRNGPAGPEEIVSLVRCKGTADERCRPLPGTDNCLRFLSMVAAGSLVASLALALTSPTAFWTLPLASCAPVIADAFPTPCLPASGDSDAKKFILPTGTFVQELVRTGGSEFYPVSLLVGRATGRPRVEKGARAIDDEASYPVIGSSATRNHSTSYWILSSVLSSRRSQGRCPVAPHIAFRPTRRRFDQSRKSTSRKSHHVVSTNAKPR